jgi:hypothetical protein
LASQQNLFFLKRAADQAENKIQREDDQFQKNKTPAGAGIPFFEVTTQG